jgi:hypothetical protein
VGRSFSDDALVVDGDDVLVVQEFLRGVDEVGKAPARSGAWSAMSSASWFDGEWQTEEFPRRDLRAAS